MAQTQRLILAVKRDRRFQWPEQPREIEMLIRRQLLLGEDQNRIFGEGIFDSLEIRRRYLLRQVDIADFGGEARRDRTDGDRHGHCLPGQGILLN